MELVTKAEITIKIKPSEAMALLKIIDEYMLYKKYNGTEANAKFCLSLMDIIMEGNIFTDI